MYVGLTVEHVQGPKPTNNSSEKADRTNWDKFVLDLEGSTKLHDGIRCVGKVRITNIINAITLFEFDDRSDMEFEFTTSEI